MGGRGQKTRELGNDALLKHDLSKICQTARGQARNKENALFRFQNSFLADSTKTVGWVALIFFVAVSARDAQPSSALRTGAPDQSIHCTAT